MFKNSLMPLINKSTRVTTTNAIAMDLIFTNAFLNEQIRTGIRKTEISNHFPIFLITDPTTSSEIKKQKITSLQKNNKSSYKRKFSEYFAKKNLGLN